MSIKEKIDKLWKDFDRPESFDDVSETIVGYFVTAIILETLINGICRIYIINLKSCIP